MTAPLMPRATAVWLVENTTLTFEQIAAFCGMHPLEVQGIADGDVATGLVGQDPIANGQLTWSQIEDAQADPDQSLRLVGGMDKYIREQKKQKGRYTPVARRQDKPDAISWLLKHHPELTDAQLVKLVGTTKKTIAAIRDRSHWNISNLQPRDPVLLSVCTQTDLEAAIQKAKAVAERAEKAKAKEKERKKAARPAKVKAVEKSLDTEKKDADAIEKSA